MKKVRYIQSGYGLRLLIPATTFEEFFSILMVLKNRTDLMFSTDDYNMGHIIGMWDLHTTKSCIMIGEGVPCWYSYSITSTGVVNNYRSLLTYEEFMREYGADPMEEFFKALDQIENTLK